ncbi:hypothetical protein SGPA1_40887 [Streptomyces misionensis JCM 4497]
MTHARVLANITRQQVLVSVTAPPVRGVRPCHTPSYRPACHGARGVALGPSSASSWR